MKLLSKFKLLFCSTTKKGKGKSCDVFKRTYLGGLRGMPQSNNQKQFFYSANLLVAALRTSKFWG